MNIGLGIGIPFTRSNLWTSIFTPTALFMDGSTEGVWYDPSDIKLNWRRNLLTYTEQFDNVVWGKVAATVAVNAVVSPDGTQNADKVAANTTAGVEHYVEQTVVITTNQSYTTSFYAKEAGTTGNFDVAIVAVGSPSTLSVARFSITAGVIAYTNVRDGLVTSASSVAAGNGWYRLTINYTLSGTVTSHRLRIYPSSQQGTFTGDGTSGIYIWGAQLEQGSTATPYQRITDGVQDYLQYQAQPVLYRDAAGTQPVTAVEQPVGLMLDKSKGLVLGPELVSNGGFASSLLGWSQSTDNYWTFAAGRAYHANSQNYNELSQTFTAIQKPVRIEFDYECLTASNTAQWFYTNAAGVVKSFDSSGIPRLQNGVGKMTYIAIDGIQKIGFSRYNQAEFYVDNISVRELPGNHAFNSSGNSANFPVLSARYNVLNNTETLATQSVTARAAKYILSFWGTGSVALSGTYTGTLVGTGADNRVYVEFTATAGTLTLTVTGSVLKAQLEEL